MKEWLQARQSSDSNVVNERMHLGGNQQPSGIQEKEDAQIGFSVAREKAFSVCLLVSSACLHLSCGIRTEGLVVSGAVGGVN